MFILHSSFLDPGPRVTAAQITAFHELPVQPIADSGDVAGLGHIGNHFDSSSLKLFKKLRRRGIAFGGSVHELLEGHLRTGLSFPNHPAKLAARRSPALDFATGLHSC